MKGWHAKGYAQMMNELVPDEDIAQDAEHEWAAQQGETLASKRTAQDTHLYPATCPECGGQAGWTGKGDWYECEQCKLQFDPKLDARMYPETVQDIEDSRAFKGAGMIPISQIERGVYDVALAAGRVQGEQDVMNAWATASEVAAYFENTSEDEILDGIKRDHNLKLEGDRIGFADNPLSFTDERGKTQPKTTMDSWGKFSAEVDSGGIQTGKPCPHCDSTDTYTYPEDNGIWNCNNCFVKFDPETGQVMTHPENEIDVPREKLESKLAQWGKAPDLPAPNVDWGRPYGGQEASFLMPDGSPVWMFRNGQRVRFYDENGQQVGEEQANVAPAMAYAFSQGWQDVSGPQMKVPGYEEREASKAHPESKWDFEDRGDRKFIVNLETGESEDVTEEYNMFAGKGTFAADTDPDTLLSYLLMRRGRSMEGPLTAKLAYKLQEHGDGTYDVLDDAGNVVMSQESYQVASNFIEGSPRGEYSETDEVRDIVESKQADQEADPIEQARQLGEQAFLRGDPSNPASDSELMAMLEGNQVGEGLPLLDAWSEGWHGANVAAPVPGWTDDENQALRDARGSKTAEEDPESSIGDRPVQYSEEQIEKMIQNAEANGWSVSRGEREVLFIRPDGRVTSVSW